MEDLGKDGKKDCGWFLCKKGVDDKKRRFKPNPRKKVHDYCCASCRIAAWNFRTAGVEAISKMQKDIEKINDDARKMREVTKRIEENMKAIANHDRRLESFEKFVKDQEAK